jgi:hypothetical protein
VIAARVERIDWSGVRGALDERGHAIIPPILTAEECAELIALYPEHEHFRSRIEMARFGYGVGEYKYFAAPLPEIVGQLRSALYEKIAPIASDWIRAMGFDGAPLPPRLEGFLVRCHRAGQVKPTPLMLRYEAGGYNCLHQDVYGEIVFPIQVTVMLSRREIDYRGGEFLLTEQRPRAQSRGEAIVLEQGEAIIFATRYRPVRGKRGYHRVNGRHGVSRIHSGLRMTLGIIFHDAK